MKSTKQISADKYWQSIRPITAEEARDFLKREWDSPYAVLRYSECDALVAFIVECRRVMTAYTAAFEITPFSKMNHVLDEVWSLKPGADSLQALRDWENKQQSRVEDLKQAHELLEQAAKLIGVRATLFYSHVSQQERTTMLAMFVEDARKSGITIDQAKRLWDEWYPEAVSENPPVVEGETENERRARSELNQVVLHGCVDQSEHRSYRDFLKYDKRKGAGHSASTKNLAIRMLWDIWPSALKEPVKGKWSPTITLSELLNFCGHDATPKMVGTYISNERKNKEEAERLQGSR